MLDIILNLILSAVIGNVDVRKAASDFQANVIEAGEAVKRPIFIGENESGEKTLGVKTAAESVLALDKESGEILYAKNIGRRQPIASITKLMAALVFLEHNPGWEEKIVFSDEDKREGSKDMLYNGEQVSVKDLFHLGLMLSNNSAMAALVRSTGISEEEFVKLMNVKAREFGMEETEFADIIGLTGGNISTAVDISRLAQAAFTNEDISSATQTGKYSLTVANSGRTFAVYNTNYLLGSFLDQGDYKIMGGKTGFLNEAGYCFVTEVKNAKGGDVISVVLGNPTLNGRFIDTKAVLSWVFKNYIWE